MADYEKTLKINADASPVIKALDSIKKVSLKDVKDIDDNVRSTYDHAIRGVNKVKKQLETLQSKKNVLEQMLLGSNDDELTNSVQKSLSSIKDQINEVLTGNAFKINPLLAPVMNKMMSDQAEIAKKAQEAKVKDAEKEQSAMFAFAGLSKESSALSSMQTAINAGGLGLSQEQIEEANKVIAERQKMLTDIMQKQSKLNILNLLSPGKSKEKDELLKEIQEMKALYDGGSGAQKPKGRLSKLGDSLKKSLIKTFTNAIKSIGKFFVNTFKNSFNELSTMASMNMSTSLISNSVARQQQLVFGLTGGQNYAMTNAMQMLGMKGVEDLLWANSGQMAMYNRLTSVLESQYNRLEATGVFKAVQEFQIDMRLMKAQFQNTIYQFIANHKNELEFILKKAIEFMEGVLNVLGYIVKWFGGSAASAAYSGVDNAAVSSTSNSSVDNHSQQNTITVNYTNNESQNGQAEVISSAVLEKIVTQLRG